MSSVSAQRCHNAKIFWTISTTDIYSLLLQCLSKCHNLSSPSSWLIHCNHPKCPCSLYKREIVVLLKGVPVSHNQRQNQLFKMNMQTTGAQLTESHKPSCLPTPHQKYIKSLITSIHTLINCRLRRLMPMCLSCSSIMCASPPGMHAELKDR